MNQEQLSKRLQAVAALVPKGAVFADIGTDHAYLPLYLLKTEHISRAIGSEIAQGPFDNAVANSRAQGETRLDMRLGDGVQTLTSADDIDVISINGMGGKTIVNILAEGWKRGIIPVSDLLLQPNTDEWYVRFWLTQHGYAIVSETIVEENGVSYEIIAAHYDEKVPVYTREEILYGPFLLKERTLLFIDKYQKQKQHYAKLLEKIPSDTPKYRYIAQKYHELEAMLNES